MLLNKEGWNAYGIDISNNLVDHIDKKRINFFNGNIFEANFPDNYFDVIYMDSVLEHVENPMRTLIELKRILRVKGLLYLIVPNEDCLNNEFKKFLYLLALKKDLYGQIKPFVRLYHIQGFNKHSLKTVLEKAEFNILRLKDFGGNYIFWKSFKFFSPSYLREIMLFPVSLLSILIKRQIQLEILVSKST